VRLAEVDGISAFLGIAALVREALFAYPASGRIAAGTPRVAEPSRGK
jgi:hypothetical protein